MSKPEISSIVGMCLAYPVLVVGCTCYYTGKGLTTLGSFMIEASGLVPRPIVVVKTDSQ
jgi:hypothetical protein